MARRRSGGRGGSAMKRFVMTPVAFLVVVGLIYGVAQINGIHSIRDALNYMRAISDETGTKVNNCVGGKDCKILSDGSTAPTGSAGQGSGSSDSQAGTDGGSTSNSPENNGGSEASTGANKYQAALNNLTVAPAKKVAYKRSEWKHWVDVNGKCNAREQTLVNQGKDVKTDPKTCRVLTGTWVDPYSGETITNPKSIDIDHVIPLGYVARSGGQDWSPQKKQEYANDVDTVLLVTSAKENRSKSDKGPADYMPPNSAYACTYAQKWIDIAGKYRISITQADKQTLADALTKCK